MKYLNAELKDNVLNVGFSIPTVLDSLTVQIVFEELDQLVEQSQPQGVLLNFEGVSLLTSEMLGKLVAFRQMCSDQKSTLKLCNLNDSLVHLLEITKLNSLFSCHVTAESAVEEFEDEQLIA